MGRVGLAMCVQITAPRFWPMAAVRTRSASNKARPALRLAYFRSTARKRNRTEPVHRPSPGRVRRPAKRTNGLEASHIDHKLGRYLSKDLSGYLVPVNADIPELDISFIGEPDFKASPIGARGLGEVDACGVGAAIANAVFHATGVRMREVPIRPEMLLYPASGTRPLPTPRVPFRVRIGPFAGN